MPDRDFGDLGQPGADFDVFQLGCAAASIVFRDDDEILSEREQIERVLKQLQDRLAMLPRRGDTP